jgi:cytochrome oxidase assembly protein ShyY1
MSEPHNPAERQPKGDHNRRLALDIDIERFAAVAGLTQEQVHEYEMTSPDHEFDLEVARRYGEALERLGG